MPKIAFQKAAGPRDLRRHGNHAKERDQFIEHRQFGFPLYPGIQFRNDDRRQNDPVSRFVDESDSARIAPQEVDHHVGV